MCAGVGVLLNRKLAAGFGTWYSRASSEDPLLRAAHHLLHRHLSNGWRRWQSNWVDAARQGEAMRRCVGRLLNGQLSRGWGGWHASWLEASRQREAMRRAVGRMLHGQLSLGWTAWLAMVERRAEQIHAAERATRRMLNTALACGWARWCFLVSARPLDRRMRTAARVSPEPTPHAVPGPLTVLTVVTSVTVATALTALTVATEYTALLTDSRVRRVLCAPQVEKVAVWRELFALALVFGDWAEQAEGHVRKPHYLATTASSRRAVVSAWDSPPPSPRAGAPGSPPKLCAAPTSPCSSMARLARSPKVAAASGIQWRAAPRFAPPPRYHAVLTEFVERRAGGRRREALLDALSAKAEVAEPVYAGHHQQRVDALGWLHVEGARVRQSEGPFMTVEERIEWRYALAEFGHCVREGVAVLRDR